MPRNAAGTYQLPAGNPVVSGTIITSEWANSTLPDIAAELTSSLSREGEGGMLAPLKHAQGSALLPSITFLADVQSGLYLQGAGEIMLSISGLPVMRWTSAGPQVRKGDGWGPIGAGTFDGPDPTLNDAEAAVIIGSMTPDAAPHVAVGPTAIQAKSDGTTPDTLRLNPLGGNVSLGGWDDNEARVKVEFPHLTLTNQIPGIPYPNCIAFRRSDDVPAGEVGFINNEMFHISNHERGAPIMIAVTGEESALLNALEAKPDLAGYGQHGIETRALRIVGSTEANQDSTGHGLQVSGNQHLKIGSDSIQTKPLVGSSYHSTLRINATSGGSVTIGNGTTGAQINVSGPDAYVHFSRLGTRLMETLAPEEGGMRIRNTLTGTGLERVLTNSDATAFEVIEDHFINVNVDYNRSHLFAIGTSHVLNLPEISAEMVGMKFTVYALNVDVSVSAAAGASFNINGAGADSNPRITAGHMALVRAASTTGWIVTVM